jgi:hypothetical protein
MKSTPNPFKKIDLKEYTELEQKAHKMGMILDPETLTIVPIREQTKYWEPGDREPFDYQGRE